MLPTTARLVSVQTVRFLQISNVTSVPEVVNHEIFTTKADNYGALAEGARGDDPVEPRMRRQSVKLDVENASQCDFTHKPVPLI